MNTLLQDKQQLVILETKCNFLKNLVESMNKDTHSMASNQRISKQGENKDEEHGTLDDRIHGYCRTRTNMQKCKDWMKQQVITPSFSICFLKQSVF
jgi:hypothetical protein